MVNITMNRNSPEARETALDRAHHTLKNLLAAYSRFLHVVTRIRQACGIDSPAADRGASKAVSMVPRETLDAYDHARRSLESATAKARTAFDPISPLWSLRSEFHAAMSHSGTPCDVRSAAEAFLALTESHRQRSMTPKRLEVFLETNVGGRWSALPARRANGDVFEHLADAADFRDTLFAGEQSDLEIFRLWIDEERAEVARQLVAHDAQRGLRSDEQQEGFFFDDKDLVLRGRLEERFRSAPAASEVLKALCHGRGGRRPVLEIARTLGADLDCDETAAVRRIQKLLTNVKRMLDELGEPYSELRIGRLGGKTGFEYDNAYYDVELPQAACYELGSLQATRR